MRVPLFALCVALSPLGVAHAQMATAEANPLMLLTNKSTTVNTLTQRIQSYAEFAKNAQRWKATWDHYYQQIARFMSVVRNPALSQQMKFDPVDPMFGVEERCGGSGGFSMATLASMAIPPSEDNVPAAQQRVCAQIQMLENAKYNATVAYFKEIAPSLEQDLRKIDAQRKTNNEQGTVAAITEASSRLSNQMRLSGEKLEKQMAGTDAMITALTKRQQTLAVKALKGQNPVLGTLVKTATLKAALAVKK